MLDEDEDVFRNFEALSAAKVGPHGSELPAVLVLGGSTFMGRETVQALLDLPARVCVVNRGRTYWGTDDPSMGRAARVVADRRDAELFAARIDVATERLGTRWALVADFSAYNSADIQTALNGLRSRFDMYAYISSDSVYEVSSWAGDGWERRPKDPSGPRVQEAASARPEDEKTRKRLRNADTYGDGKLRAEEALAAALAKDSTAGRAVCLRLPDVIGPFDDTLRLWAFWHWLQAGPQHPPQVHEKTPAAKRQRQSSSQEGKTPPAPEDIPLAVVFCRDVARFVVHLLQVPAPAGAPRCDAVNLACERQPTLRGLLETLAAASGLGEPVLAPTARPKTFLPSVDRPWPLSCDRMLKAYGFAPTPLEEVLRITADWFRDACSKFPGEAAEAARKLPPGPREAAIARAALPSAPPSSSSSDESDS
uniref:NAD-dependent epimerase/dehydratase domain-containing protein n=1 Tax=Alexandrium catenella TaxID=2925 RepID=A0A7S1WSK0_ALECA